MKRNIKLSAVLSAGLVIASTNAYAVLNMNSIGDDGNPNSVGNVGARAKNYQTLLYINNQTDEKISKVVITNKDNKQLYTTKLDCNANNKCTLNLGKTVFTNDVVLKFYGAKNHMISAYNYMGKLDGLGVITVDDKWLGIYVFNKLKQISQMSPDVLNNELTYFFQNYSSPDGTPDIFEELGLYFLAQNGGANEDKFYKGFLKQLEQDKILGAKVISPTMAKSTLAKSSEWTEFSSNGLMCNKVANGLATWTKLFAGFIPVVGSGISTVLGFATQASKDFCADGAVNEKFNQIQNKLNQLSSEMMALGYDLNVLSQRLDQEVARLYLSNMETHYRNISTSYFMPYNGLNTPLVSFVNNTGGLSSSFKNNNNVRNLISSMRQQLEAFDTFASRAQLTNFKNSLDRWCNNEKTMTGDIIQDRIQCNLMKNQVASYLYAGAAQFELMLGDEINTVIAARKNGNIDNNWLAGNIVGNMTNGFEGKGWDNSIAYVNEYIGTRLDSAITILMGKDGKDVYIPLKGFPEKLSDSMMAANCGYKTENGNVLPAVSQWILNNRDANAGHYIMTACQSGKEIINSRYYYKQRNSSAFDYDVVNVMGVLVPNRFFHGSSGGNYGANTAFPWVSYSRLMTIYSNSDDNQLKAIFNVPQNSAAVGYGFNPENMNQKYIEPKGFTEKFNRNGKSYSRNIFTSTTTANGNPAFEVSYFMADWWQIGSGEFFSFIRNTDSSGISNVWAMRSKINIPIDPQRNSAINSERDLVMTQQCMTNDCNISASDSQRNFLLGEISFPNTKVSWYYPNIASNPLDVHKTKNPELMMYVNGKPIYSK